MTRKKMLIDLNLCTGCWTCAMACKVINELADDEYWVTVRTNGNGEGIDFPAGTWPNLHMSWQPVWSKKCVDCGKRQAQGKQPFCVDCCPVRALRYGDDAEAREAELRERGYEIYTLPSYEGTRDNVVYASK